MSFSSLSEFIDTLEKEGELIRVKGFVNPELEISEIADRFSKLPGGGKALLFENTGTGFPVLMNALGSEKRMCLALGVKNLDDVAVDIAAAFGTVSESRHSIISKLSILPALAKYSRFMPSQISRNAPCQQIILNGPDLDIFPVLKTWPFDGGRFFTFPLVHTLDPETGTRNVGMYRMQVFDKKTTGMHWHRHKTGASHFEKYKKAGKIMPVAVALGGDPVLTYAATAPLPDQLDEYIFAGFLRKSSVRLVKAISQDIEVPADADIIIEGYVDPAEDFRPEGPFGDHTGFYSLTDNYPVFHVTCITHRKNAVFPATVVGIPPMEDAWIAKATERIFLWPIKKTVVPELVDMNIPEFGVAHNLTIISIHKTYPGQAEKAMNALWGAGQMMFNKFMVVVDDSVQTMNYLNIMQHLSELDFTQQLIFARGPLDVLDHSAPKMGFGSKMGIDLTTILPEEQDSCSKVFMPELPIAGDFSDSILKSEYSATRFPGTRVLIINVKKSERSKLLNDVKFSLDSFQKNYPRIILLVDENVDITDYFLTAWVSLNNINPARDVAVLPYKNDHVLVLDATSKDYLNNQFARSWPNVIVMSEEVIESIDKHWESLIPFPFIVSPSKRYRKLINKNGAEANSGFFPAQ